MQSGRLQLPVRRGEMMANRHSTRLPGFDYSQSGLYFITICTFNRESLFGTIVGAIHESPTHMELNEMGKIIASVWESLPKRFPIILDGFQIMPNHVHMIIQIDQYRTQRAHRDAPLQRSLLSQIIGYFKMNSSKTIHVTNPNIHVWQRNFFEHIIRSENDLNKIREYIVTNPRNWPDDENFVLQ